MSLPLKQLKIVMMGLEKQGCSIRDTKSGYMILLPEGGSVTFHKSTSDHRAVLNMRSRIKRAGLDWPLDALGIRTKE